MPIRLPPLVTLVPLLALVAGCGGGGSSPAVAGHPAAVAPTSSRAPLAVARADEAVVEGSVVSLDGSASRAGNGGVLHYLWSQTAGPSVALRAADAATASFVAPAVNADASVEFQLVVTDSDGATDRDRVALLVRPRKLVLSGSISVVPGTAVDGDVNDWSAPRSSNNRPEQAQALAEPVAVGGYVNVAGSGAPGPLHDAGDAEDFYRVSLSAGQSIALTVSDPALGDVDLYLWDAAGERIIDASLGTGARESVTVPSDGEYLLEVTAFSGASNYLLVTGDAQNRTASSAMRLSDDFVPGEIVLAKPHAAGAASARPGSLQTVAGPAVAFAAGPPVLAQLDDVITASAVGADGARRSAIPDPLLWRKYRTLLAVKSLRARRSVAYAQLNYRVQAQSIPADPLYPLQWHYSMIRLPDAWSLTMGDSAVTVAVVDSGVLPDHPDLAGQLLPGYDFVQSTTSSGDGDGIDPDPTDPGDGDGSVPSGFHGTHVAGTVAAVAGNGIGGTGVAPGVRIRPVRVLGRDGATSYDIIEGLRYAAGLENDSGTRVSPADVINLSLGRTGECWPAEQAAFQAVRAAGVVVVAAAGNDAIDAAAAFPADCDDVIAVGAVDARGALTSYSNFGSAVDVLAPGGSWDDVDGDGRPDAVLSLTADDTVRPMRFGYGYKTGTSMASPHVAAAVALMKSVNPALTPGDIDRMLAAGEMTRADGVIDAYRAVYAALDTGGASPSPHLTVSPPALDFADSYTYAEIDVESAGNGRLAVDVPRPSEGWVRVAALQVDGDHLGRYAVTVDRGGLAPGSYSASIAVGSDSGTVNVSVTARVSDSTIMPDAGHLYVLLIDPSTGRVVRQVQADAVDGRYSYAFSDLDDGRYRLVAGSDADGDLMVCDAGESCGAYPGSGQVGDLVLESDTRGADFTVGRTVSMNGEAPGTGLQAPRSAADQSNKQVNAIPGTSP